MTTRKRVPVGIPFDRSSLISSLPICSRGALRLSSCSRERPLTLTSHRMEFARLWLNEEWYTAARRKDQVCRDSSGAQNSG